MAAILLVGALLRFWALGQTPTGLYQDEAFNGLDALGVLAGNHPLYFPANNGREPLFIYLVSASVAALGRTPLAVRLPSALLGTLTIPAVYILGRAAFNRRVAALAAFVVATTFWPVALSRIGFRAIALPCLLAFALAAAWWGVRSEKPSAVVLGGVLYGLSFYTYLAGRFTPLALLLFAAYLWFTGRLHRRTQQGGRLTSRIAFFLLPALLVALPLGLYALTHPDVLFGRAGQVSIFSPAINGGDLWGTLGRHTLDALGLFVWRGDTIARHNLPGRPAFDPLTGLAFLAGVILSVRRSRRSPAAALTLIWVAVMLLPTLLAEDTPHFLRGVGVWPMLAFLPAIGMEAGYTWLARHSRVLARLALGLTLTSGLALTGRDYFVRYARDPITGYYFQSTLANLATEARSARAEGSTIYLDRRFWDQFASLRFLLPDGPDLHLFDEGQPLSPHGSLPVILFIWPYDAVAPSLGALPERALIEASPGPLYRGDLDSAAYPLYNRYMASTALPSGPSPGCFEGGICLESAEIGSNPQTGETLVKLRWFANSAPGENYHVFLQAHSGGVQLAGADGPPASGLYPTDWWRRGDHLLETRTVHLPEGVETADIRWLVGLYDPASGQRLTLSENELDRIELHP